MSKGLRNMNKRERKEAVNRRLSNQNDKAPKGLGYLAAKDYKSKDVKEDNE